MNWHKRYAQQANWTRELRSYIFEKTNFGNTQRVLEVGCGTGAILAALQAGPSIYGLDIDRPTLVECGLHAPRALRTQGNALALPYPDRSFDIIYSHFLLLWVADPILALQEMKRVARQGGNVIAFAEPDYLQRVDEPQELIPLGRWQTEALRAQGADPGLGARLAELFFQAGIEILETGTMQGRDTEPSMEEWQIEWDVIEADLQGRAPAPELPRLKELDQAARRNGHRHLYVPTYFAWGRV